MALVFLYAKNYEVLRTFCTSPHNRRRTRWPRSGRRGCWRRSSNNYDVHFISQQSRTRAGSSTNYYVFYHHNNGVVALPSPSRTRAGGRRLKATGKSSRGPRFSGRPSARSSRGRAGAPRRAPRRTRPARGRRDHSTAYRRRRAAGKARTRTRRRVWNSTRTRVGQLCPSPPSPSAGRSPADTEPVPRTCAQINQ